MSKKLTKTPEYFYNLFQKAYNYNSSRFEAYRELSAFYELTQDELPQYNIDKPWVYNINAPYSTDAINLRVASLQANDYLGELEPMSPQDEDTVAKLNYAYQALWNEVNTDKHISEAVLRAAVVREAYTHVVFENKETGGTDRRRVGVLTPYFIDPASVHIDPQATSLKDADYVCITERISAKKVAQTYPKFDLENAQFSMYSPEQRGEIYYGTDYTTEQNEVLTKITIYEHEADGYYKTVLVEAQIVEKPKKLLINNYPIAQLRWQKKLKTPYGTSLMDMLLPLQKTINEIESAIANTALQFSSPSYVLSEEAGIDANDLALTAGTPGAVYVVAGGIDLDNVIKPLMKDRKVDEQLVTIKQEIERTIYKLAGVNEEFLGNLGTTGNTSGGTDMALQRAQIIEQLFMVNLEEYVEDLTRIYVDYITKAFSGETLYVNRRETKNRFEQINIPEMEEAPEYNFYIKLDVKTKYSKNQQRMLMKELYQQQEQYQTPIKGLTFIDVLKTYDFPQSQELVERFEQLTNMDANQRAELIIMLTTIGQQYQIEEEMVQQAIVEIVSNLEETPTVEMFMQAVEQAKMQEQTAQANVVQALQGNAIQDQMALTEPTGDESYSMGEGE